MPLFGSKKQNTLMITRAGFRVFDGMTVKKFPMPEGVFNKSLLQDPAKALEAMKQLGLAHQDAWLVIPDTACFLETFSFPQEKQSQLEQSIIDQAQAKIPIDQSHAYWDYHQTSTKESIDVVYASTEQTFLDPYLKLCHDAGVTISGVGVEGLGIAAEILPQVQMNQENPQGILLVTIGSDAVALNVFTAQKTFSFASLASFPGGQFTQTIAQSVPQQSTATVADVAVTTPERGPTVLQMALDGVIAEMKKTIAYATSRNNSVGQVVVAGDLALIPSVETYFSNALGLPVIKGVPSTANVALEDAGLSGMTLQGNQALNLLHHRPQTETRETVKTPEVSASSPSNIDPAMPTKNSRTKTIIAAVFVLATFAGLGFVLYRYVIVPMMGA